MGKGGRSEANGNMNTKIGGLGRVPHEKPPFTLREMKKAIPPHCFNRSLIRSFAYLIFDFATCFILYYLATNFIPLLANHKYLTYLAWTVYAIAQGCFMSSLWLLGHECGHNAFSDYFWLNDTIGFVLHSLLLIPYFSFKFSHRRHHSNTSSLEREENYVPKFKHNLAFYSFKNPIGRVYRIVLMLTIGMPLYLIFNAGGRPYDGFASHFYPYSPIFSKRERLYIWLSDIGCLATCYGLYNIAATKGMSWVLLVYGGPYVVLGAFFIIVTLLNHTHPSLAHYDSSEWDWLRGALGTVDRDYGFILNKLFLNATDAHVVHHLFPTMPHYHIKEATEAVKPILGDYYLFDPTPLHKALWREIRDCLYVEKDEEGDQQSKGVYWYNNI